MAGGIISTEVQANQNYDGGNYKSALIVLTSLFFMWGFITCMNDILIPFVKKVFELDRFTSMLVQFAFFGAYFVGSVIYFMISFFWGDPITKIGYKNGLLLGLIISAIACAMFFPAAQMKLYGLFLVALFVMGIGFTLLQIAANPYVALLGKPETASSRLNLSQAFNSFGTTIAPIIGGFLVFHFFAKIGEPLISASGNPVLTDSGSTMSGAGVQIPYLIFAAVFLILAIVIKITKLPEFQNNEKSEKGLGALKFRHLNFGMIAIFVYVGAEVSIGSLFINYAQELVGYPEMTGKSFLAFYWGGAMIGRFLGAISLNKANQSTGGYIKMALVSVVAYLAIYFFVFIESGFTFNFMDILPFTIFLIINYLGFIIGKSLPGRTLMIFSLIIIALLVITTLTTGHVALWAVIGIGLFNSIMWSNIFTLAIDGLGKHTSQGSSLLVMMILGGALIPIIQGAVADKMNGYQYSFFIPAICYMYLAWYGFKGHVRKMIQE